MPQTYKVTANYSKFGTPSAGEVSFTPSTRTKHADDNVILTEDELTIDLEDGKLSVDLYATDDAGWSDPFEWVVTERIIDGVVRTYTFDLTADLDLADVDEA